MKPNDDAVSCRLCAAGYARPGVSGQGICFDCESDLANHLPTSRKPIGGLPTRPHGAGKGNHLLEDDAVFDYCLSHWFLPTSRAEGMLPRCAAITNKGYQCHHEACLDAGSVPLCSSHYDWTYVPDLGCYHFSGDVRGQFFAKPISRAEYRKIIDSSGLSQFEIAKAVLRKMDDIVRDLEDDGIGPISTSYGCIQGHDGFPIFSEEEIFERYHLGGIPFPAAVHETLLKHCGVRAENFIDRQPRPEWRHPTP